MALVSAANMADYVRKHRAWGASQPGCSTGFTLPDFADGEFQRLPHTDAAGLASRGVRFRRPVASGELIIWLGRRARSLDLLVDAAAGSTGFIAVEGPGHVCADVSMHARDHVLILAGSDHGRTVKASLWGTGTTCFFGAGGSCNSASLLVEGDHVSLQVGDDAMFSDGIDVATSDSHGIFELADTGRLINPPASVVIHRHVWVGKHVSIGKGRTIGAGSIIGQRSVVTADVPARAIAAGNPARIVREGVTWTRPWPYDRAALDHAVRLVGSPAVD